MKEKLFSVIGMTVTITSITQLALSQLSIRIMRLSSAELTGISYFAFIIFGLVTLFAVSRIKDNPFARIFAFIMNLVTAVCGLWCLQMLFSDEIFFRNLYYNLNRQTQVYEILSTGKLVSSSVPLALIILGIAVYGLCALAIIMASFMPVRKK